MILAGTGHRPHKLGGYTQAAADRLKAIALIALMRLKPTHVITGMALGWDTALALAAIELGIPVTAAVPFEGQEKQWPINSQAAYRRILSKCAKVEYVCEPGYSASKMIVRNNWMVDRCDVLLAMYDGTAGGTKKTVDYAMKCGKTIDNVYNWYLHGKN